MMEVTLAQVEVQWFGRSVVWSQTLSSVCQSVLGQDTKTWIAPEDIAIGVWVNVWIFTFPGEQVAPKMIVFATSVWMYEWMWQWGVSILEKLYTVSIQAHSLPMHVMSTPRITQSLFTPFTSTEHSCIFKLIVLFLFWFTAIDGVVSGHSRQLWKLVHKLSK